MRKVKELRNLSPDELLAKLKTFKEDLYKFRYQIHTGKVEKPAKIKETRHAIARIKTILKEQQWQKEKTRKDA